MKLNELQEIITTCIRESGGDVEFDIVAGGTAYGITNIWQSCIDGNVVMSIEPMHEDGMVEMFIEPKDFKRGKCG